MHSRAHFSVLISILLLFLSRSLLSHGQHIDNQREHLKFAVVLSRHGVRSPTWANERLDEYSTNPWPKWDVGPGLLTAHGKKLMTELGSYYRLSFASNGLLQAQGCSDAAHVYLYTDSDQRTIETGHGLADGLFAGCDVNVHSGNPGQQDEMFHSSVKIGQPNNALAYSALAGRIGNNPAALSAAYQAQLQRMRGILFECIDASCKLNGKKDLSNIPSELAVGRGDHMVEMKGPLPTAATFAENLQLEFLQGMTSSQLGWGKVDEATIRDLMALHSASSDLVQRTPYIARVQASNLLAHISSTLQQAEEKHTMPGSIGSLDDKIVFLVGHDTNIANVAALLDAHWLVNGYQRDDAAPGGALVFELWQNSIGADEVRTYYIVQTPGQMRDASPLSLAAPPAKATIFLPECSRADTNSSCALPDFLHLLNSAIDRTFVQ